MEKINRKILDELWNMKNLSLKEALSRISTNPDLKFLLTAAGVWWGARLILFIVLAANIIYYIIRVFALVLS